MTYSSPLWIPSTQSVANAPLTEFAQRAAQLSNCKFASYQDLHKWSIEHSPEFWRLVWEYCSIVGETGKTIIANSADIFEATFFPEAKLNFAENLLWKTGIEDALVFYGEDQVEWRLSFDELHSQVSQLQQFFVSKGVRKGDRIAAMVANTPESIVCLLAAASIGAIWCSCSPDFGERAALNRFCLVEPILFIAVNGYRQNGIIVDVTEKTKNIANSLFSVQHTLQIEYVGSEHCSFPKLPRSSLFSEVLDHFPPIPMKFERFSFSHPLFILFSSGTVGSPKCIVHGAGGTLLQHKKEHQLHCSLREGDRVFYATTCGWMMWNWLVTALASGTTLILYDGSPIYPDGNAMFDLVDMERITFFGTSAKYIDTLRKSGVAPAKTHHLSSLRTIGSTGSPLSGSGFEYVYRSVKSDVHLASISGGTDIVSCFVMGVPTEPVWAGEIQAPALGMAVDVWSEDGVNSVRDKGELVCTKPFPSRPVCFWNDPNSRKYRSAYFERFPNVWHHGDYAQWTENSGLIIHGRSDATLNRGGVRIGTAEIYNQVECLPEVAEALCVGENAEDDVSILLFVKMAPGYELDNTLRNKIASTIANGASPNHIPDFIESVQDIPRTKSGKISEIAVRDIIHGRVPENLDALENPETLSQFYAFANR